MGKLTVKLKIFCNCAPLKLNVKFDIFSPNVDETILKNEKPQNIVKRLSHLKANKALLYFKNKFIISADTVVYANKKIIEKTHSRSKALKNLSLLSGRRHKVYTGLTFIDNESKKYFFLSTTIIKFKLLKKIEIEKYLDTNQWKGCAGSYSIQGFAESFIVFISGSYSSVVGLPLNKVYNILINYNLLYKKSNEKNIKSKLVDKKKAKG